MKKHLELSSALTEAQMTMLLDHLYQSETLIANFAVSLSDEERRGVRTVAEGREGYVAEALRIANEFNSELPRSFDVAEFETVLALFNQWRRLLVLAEKIAEQVDDTSLALGIDLMTKADRVNTMLQAGRRDNANLDRALTRLDDYNKRFGTRPSNPADNSTNAPITPPEN